MWSQVYDPFGSMVLSAAVAAVPVFVLLSAIGIFEVRAHVAAILGLLAALAVAVRIGCSAERHDHHPDLEISWGRLRVRWTTHDAGGLTAADLRGAEASDEAAR